MKETKESFSANVEVKANFNKIITKLINESPERLKSLFDGELKTSLIQPLFRKINESVNKTNVVTQTIDLNFQDLIDDAVTNLLYDKSFAGDIKTLYSTSIADIFKSFKDIDTKSFHKQFIDQFNKKIEKNIEDLSFIKADINVSDLNIFEKDKDSNVKFKNLTKKALEYIENNIDKITISNLGIDQTSLFNTLFSVAPEFGKESSRKYTSLLNKTLNQLLKATENIKLETQGIDQNNIFNMLFHDVDVGGFFWKNKLKQLREEVLNKIIDLKDKINIDDKPIDQNSIINILFQEEVGGFFWKFKFNNLREEALDKLSKQTERFKLTEEPISQSNMLNILFDNINVGGGYFGGWRTKFNELREKTLETLNKSVASNLSVNNKPLNTQDLIQLLFSDVPEISTGMFGLIGPNIKSQINDLRKKILDNMSNNISPITPKEDEDATEEKLKRDHVTKTVHLHIDSLNAIEKSFTNSIMGSDIVRETNQEKRFKKLFTFLEEDLLDEIKNLGDSMSPKEDSTLIQTLKALLLRSVLPVAATVAAGGALGFGIGKLLEPGFNKLLEFNEEGQAAEEKEEAKYKQGKALVDLQVEWMKNKKRPNGEEATKERVAYDVQTFLSKDMKPGVASPYEVKMFKKYAQKQLGEDIFDIKPALPQKMPKNISTKEQSNVTTNKTDDIISSSIEPVSKETSLESNNTAPLSINFVPLIDHLNGSFSNIGKTVDNISNKLDILTKILSEGKSTNSSIILPQPSPKQDSTTTYDSKNNINIYRNDYNSTRSFAVV